MLGGEVGAGQAPDREPERRPLQGAGGGNALGCPASRDQAIDLGFPNIIPGELSSAGSSRQAKSQWATRKAPPRWAMWGGTNGSRVP